MTSEEQNLPKTNEVVNINDPGSVPYVDISVNNFGEILSTTQSITEQGWVVLTPAGPLVVGYKQIKNILRNPEWISLLSSVSMLDQMESGSADQNKILELNVEEKYVWVQPGVVLDHLNSYLKPYGLWFPVDVSTSSRATIGGMSANNSCGSRSLYYGNMVHNVLAIEAILDDGSLHTFNEINKNYLTATNNQDRFYKIIDKFLHLRQKVSKDTVSYTHLTLPTKA